MARSTKALTADESKEDFEFVQFTIESRILKELGERLVSDAEVALTELIKNAYDADAKECRITVDSDSIVIEDDGCGMTFDAFTKRWMRIATGNKADNPFSKLYNRKLTGSKGVGRFAVRFLGEALTLETVAIAKNGKKEKIIATFDWMALDQSEDITTLRVPYRRQPTKEKIGTKLTISSLRVDIGERELYAVKSGVLTIASPVFAFISDAPSEVRERLFGSRDRNEDPGFNVVFEEGHIAEDEEATEPLAALVLENYVGRTTIDLKNTTLRVKVFHANRGLVLTKKYVYPNTLGSELYADIRYFPRRSGVFAKKDFKGTNAWPWVRKNKGIKVYDHGFHIKPYGTDDDDWLFLDHDTSHNNRYWRSELMKDKFPMDPVDASQPKRNPMVSLPTNYQMIGAVFVESQLAKNGRQELLSPNMDRQGFVANRGFSQLQEITRFAVELIAAADKKIQLEDEEVERNQKYEERQKEIDSVIAEIKGSKSLTKDDKDRIVAHYSKIRSDINKLDEYDRSAREGLEAMSLLGVVAGFMTHEFQAALETLEKAGKTIRNLANKDPGLNRDADAIQESINYFNGYIDYTKLFVSNLHLTSIKPYRSLPVINHVISTFGKFQAERLVTVDTTEIDTKLVAPLLPMAMYQGIVHNLYTNALKVLLVHPREDKLISIQAWNDKSKHVLQILDNGPGIPPEIQNRIWDPLYTTTSSENNPLGSGMGLGLPLVKKVVEGKKGRVFLADPPAGFSTCFRVELPLEP